MLDRAANYSILAGKGMLKFASFRLQCAVDLLDREEPDLVAELVQWLIVVGIKGGFSLGICHFDIEIIPAYSLIRVLLHLKCML